MKPNILIVGSSNTDMVIKTNHLPKPGETILGGAFFMNAGGKGANQAVAAARLGGDVTFICKTGNDVFGQEAKQLFSKEKINTNYILMDAINPSGVALILVDKKAENCIAVASGANANLMPDDLPFAQAVIELSNIVLMQLEIPLQTVQHIAALSFAKNIPLILNPAPACILPDDLLKMITIITPNETEAEILTGIKITNEENAREAAIYLHQKGIQTVIITLGKEGALVLHNDVFTQVPSVPVEAIDTTAAGDVFNGALAVALSEGKAITEAAAFACKAAAISVTRLGAQASAPYKHEV